MGGTCCGEGAPGRMEGIEDPEPGVFGSDRERESVYVSAVLYVRYVSYVLYVLSVLRVLCIFYTRSTMAPSPEKPEPDHDHPLPGHRPPH